MRFHLLPLVFVTLATSFLATGQTYTDLHDFNCYTEGCNPGNPALLAQGRDGDLYGTSVTRLFTISPSGAFSVFYTFVSNGSSPERGGLTLGTDGSFYGTTFSLGEFNLGTVFKITPAGSLTVLHNFTGGSDGSNPNAPPVQGTDGNFYGTTEQKTAYKITSSGQFTVLGSLLGIPEGPLMQGRDGKFYGTTERDGCCGDESTVFSLTTAGKVTTLYTFTYAGAQGDNPYGGLVQGTDGDFYGTATSGGTFNGGVVFKITPKGVPTVLYNFDPYAITGYKPVAGLVLATDGNFYGTTWYGGNVDAGNGVIFKITPTGTYSVIYNFDGTHGAGAIATPMQHTNGKIYGVTVGGGDLGGGVVYSLDLGLGQFVSIVNSSGKVGKTVEILGQGFTGTTKVSFNGVSATFSVVSDTYLTTVVPAGATTGFISVATPGATLKSNRKFLVVPSILSFNPTSGQVGTPVTITGTSFSGAKKVTFAGVSATFTVVSDTQISTTVPTGAQTGKIQVTTPGGIATSATNFTVTP